MIFIELTHYLRIQNLMLTYWDIDKISFEDDFITFQFITKTLNVDNKT